MIIGHERKTCSEPWRASFYLILEQEEVSNADPKKDPIRHRKQS